MNSNIIKMKDFDISRLSLKPAQKAKNSPMNYAIIQYNNPKTGQNTDLFLQTDWIKITTGGITKYNESWDNAGKKRAHLTLPVEGKIHKVMTKINKKLSDNDFLKEAFSGVVKSWKKNFGWNQLVREGYTSQTGEKYSDTIKIKFLVDYDNPNVGDDEDNVNLNTKAYVYDESNKKTPVEPQTLKGFEDVIQYQSEVRVIFKVLKVYCVNNNYGVTLEAACVGVRPRLQSMDYTDINGFVDSDDEEESETVEETAAADESDDSDDDTAKQELKTVDEDSVVSDDDDSDDEDSDDDDSDDDDSDEETSDIPIKASKKEVKKSKSSKSKSKHR